ncbi:MAG: NADH-quinone oxidoreductase subunit NuoH [Anaerolineae bacterium]
MSIIDIINNPVAFVGDLLKSVLGGFLPSWATTLILMILVVSVILGFLVFTMLFMTWMERKVVGRIQDRLGPNRVGPLGLLQPIADAIKLLTKEDITPVGADRVVYNLAPIVVVIPALMVFAVIPFGRGMIATDLNIGFLYIVAISSTSTIAILMAGWGSNNKYSLLGGMRAVAQFVSYEIPMVLAAVGVILLTGSLSMGVIVDAQASLPFILLQPIGFLIFLISGVSEVNRSPFDIPEAESEIVAGYHIEYSGLKFAMYFLAEFISAFAISAIATTLFLGGWQGPLLPPWAWFLIKTYILVFVMMWLRGTLPRLRVDQLMGLAWKVLVPLALVNIMVTGLVNSFTRTQGWWGIGWSGSLLTALTFLVANFLMAALFVWLYSSRRPAMAGGASAQRA